LNGYCTFKKESEEKEIPDSNINNNSSVKIEWMWKTKVSYNKVELLRNQLNDNEIFINSKDGQEISIDLGNYICRLMIKRLTKEEVKNYMDNKKEHDEKLLYGRGKDLPDYGYTVNSNKNMDIENNETHTNTKIINIKNLNLRAGGKSSDKPLENIEDINSLIYNGLTRNRTDDNSHNFSDHTNSSHKKKYYCDKYL